MGHRDEFVVLCGRYGSGGPRRMEEEEEEEEKQEERPPVRPSPPPSDSIQLMQPQTARRHFAVHHITRHEGKPTRGVK